MTGEEGIRIRKRLSEVLHDPDVVGLFEGTTGNVVGDEFLFLSAKIDPDKSDRSPKAAPQGYGKNLPESVLRGIEEKLDDEAAEGVLTVLPRGTQPKSFLSFFGVGKRDLTTSKVELTATNVRIVGDLNRNGINEATDHLARQTDNIHRILQRAAPFTKSGFVAQVDISQMFHCFNLHPEL